MIHGEDERLPFADLRPGSDAAEIREAVERVLASGWFVLGPEVEAFEAEFAAAAGAKHAVGVASGTDAIALALRAAGVNPGDEVIVPAMTAAFTALAVVAAGATPVIADVDPRTLTLDGRACADAVTSRTRAIVPVHLYGQPADMMEIMAVADRHRLVVIEDCCQAHLATCNGLPVGTIGAAGAFSFYPTKNLAALGDGGAVMTSDGALADRVRLLRNGGQTHRNHHAVAGVNSRLDELQAAILRVRLPNLLPETALRRLHAAFYRGALHGAVVPVAERDAGHVYHLFPVRSARREALQAHLTRAGIETLIHYPVPLHKQPAFANLAPRDCPVAAQAADELLSLPLHPRLHARQAARVADAIQTFEKGSIDA
ncbi:MAG TPA: DegT/DnrJ/EryC1/StrS family aminotransferase [Vicinamibacterales bacterium]|nr:DegT/DnrJ/EryC1/StrS family aminotransferase [Vicinamibacterales bacterium]